MAKQTKESLESLEKRLMAIYGPLEGLRFEAWYNGKKPIKITGYERDVFAMFNVGYSEEANDAVTTILEKLQEEKFNGKLLSDIVWKGITRRGNYYNLWILEPEGDFKEGKRYHLTFCRPSVEIFDEPVVEWKKDYTAGMNILIKLT